MILDVDELITAMGPETAAEIRANVQLTLRRLAERQESREVVYTVLEPAKAHEEAAKVA